MGRDRQTFAAAAKLAGFALVAILVTLSLVETIRPAGDGGARVQAMFTNASRLAPGDQVRAAGVVSGQVEEVELTREGLSRVKFRVDRDVPLTVGSRATIKYLNLVGDR